MTRYPQILGLAFAAAAFAGTAFAADGGKLPPCEPGKPVPSTGCMAPKDPPNNPLDKLHPAPPLTVPSGPDKPHAVPLVPGAPPSQAAPTTPGTVPGPAASDSPAVIKPPPTGDHDVVKPPVADPNMPVVRPDPAAKG